MCQAVWGEANILASLAPWSLSAVGRGLPMEAALIRVTRAGMELEDALVSLRLLPERMVESGGVRVEAWSALRTEAYCGEGGAGSGRLGVRVEAWSSLPVGVGWAEGRGGRWRAGVMKPPRRSAPLNP